MFDKTYEDRMGSWVDFRQTLEQSKDPIQDVIDNYNTAPTVSIHTDAWDQKSWPDPWQLLQENQYCEFTRVLGMCYSLQLTDRFNGSSFSIIISKDREKSESYYILVIDKTAIGYYNSTYIPVVDLPTTLITEKIYVLPQRQ